MLITSCNGPTKLKPKLFFIHLIIWIWIRVRLVSNMDAGLDSTYHMGYGCGFGCYERSSLSDVGPCRIWSVATPNSYYILHKNVVGLHAVQRTIASKYDTKSIWGNLTHPYMLHVPIMCYLMVMQRLWMDWMPRNLQPCLCRENPRCRTLKFP